MIGIREEEKFDPVARINYGWRQFITAGTLIFAVLGHMITHGFSLNDLGGPVAIYAGTSQATSLGINGILAFLAMLSINLGIVNLIPIPALDRGEAPLKHCRRHHSPANSRKSGGDFEFGWLCPLDDPDGPRDL